MKQISFAQAEHQNKKKVTRRERFLAQMEALMPWPRLIAALSPSCFPNAAGKRGRPSIGLERMLIVDATIVAAAPSTKNQAQLFTLFALGSFDFIYINDCR